MSLAQDRIAKPSARAERKCPAKSPPRLAYRPEFGSRRTTINLHSGHTALPTLFHPAERCAPRGPRPRLSTPSPNSPVLAAPFKDAAAKFSGLVFLGFLPRGCTKRMQPNLSVPIRQCGYSKAIPRLGQNRVKSVKWCIYNNLWLLVGMADR